MNIIPRLQRLALSGLMIAALLMGGPALSPASAQAPAPAFEPVSCWSGIDRSADPQCGYVVVPENRVASTGKTIRLAVMVFKATGGAPDPIIFLQGGPGGGSVADFGPFLGPLWVDAMGRDVIFIDQRGTGLSQPSLQCEEATRVDYEQLDSALTAAEQKQQRIEALQACRDRLTKAGVDLSAFNNIENAADVRDTIAALGYTTYNLYGVSYGTLLALTVMRNHPENVRSAILDSLYPPQADGMTEYLLTTRRVLDQLFEGCRQDRHCNRAYPDLERVTYDLIGKLDRQPINIMVRHPRTGREYSVRVDGPRLVDILFTAFYITPYIGFLPAIITLTADGSYRRLEQLASDALFAFEDINVGMYWSVTCASEFPFSSEDKANIAAMALPTEMRQGQADYALEGFEACRVWNVNTAPAVENEAVTSDLPTLVISGQYDPITPAVYGDITARTLSRSTHIVVPGQGHGTLFQQCAARIMAAFVKDPAKPVELDCLKRVPAPDWEIIQR